MAEDTRVNIEEDIPQEGPYQHSVAKKFSLRQICHDDYGRPVLYMAFVESKNNCKNGEEWDRHVAYTIQYADTNNPNGLGIIVDLIGYDKDQGPDNLTEAINRAKAGRTESKYEVKYIVVLNVQNPVTVWEDKEKDELYTFIPKNAIEPDGGSRDIASMMEIFKDRVPLSQKVATWLIETRAHLCKVDKDQEPDFFLHSQRSYWATPKFLTVIEMSAKGATPNFKPHPSIAGEPTRSNDSLKSDV